MPIHKILREAASLLPERATYARDVLYGRKRWSGADLRGKARRYGGHYADSRGKALDALQSAGGFTVVIDRGLIVAAAELGQDDYGNELVETLHGPAVLETANRYRLVRR